MKSKQKFSVSEKNLLKRQSLDNYSPLDFRSSRKISSNPLIQKNINFLRAYSNFLGKQSYGNTGNADSYFKQSLRREPFNLIRDLQLTNLVRSTASFESVSQTFNRRTRSRRTILKPRKILEFPHKEVKPKKSEEFSVKELFLTNINNYSESGSDSGVTPDFSTGDNNFLSQHSDFQTHPLEKVEETLEEDDNAADARKDKTSLQDIDKLNDRLDILLKTAMNVMVEDDREKEGEEEGEGEGADMEEKIGEAENAGEEFDESDYTGGGGEEFAGFADDEDDELKEVEAMIERASKELAEVADENQKILETLEEGDEEIEKTEEDAKDAQKPQEIKYNEATDHAVLKELEDAERQAIQTANIISKLKEQVTILSKKETMTEKEAKELEKMNMELKKQMTIFEQRTKRIQELIARSDLFENVGLFKSSLSHKEDILPKVVVCGTTEQQMPKILICDGSKIKSKSDRKKRPSSAKSSRRPDICTCETTDQGTDQDLLEMTQHYQRADLELLGMRQQQLPPQMPFQMMSSMMQPQMAPQMVPQQENTCECHQPRALQRAQQMPMTPQMQMPMSPQMQMQMQMPMQMMPPVPMVQQVNMMQQAPQRTRSPFPPMEGPMDYGEFESPRSTSRPQTQGAKDQPTGMSCGKGRGICPTEIESRLQEYSENTQFLEQQLYDMEAEVKEMHQELVAVQKEREHLEQHRKMFCSPPPCSLPTCPPTPCSPIPPCNPCNPPPVSCGPPCEVQLRELREQYKRLQDDFKSKLTEVAGLRTDNEKLKDRTRQAEDAKKDAEKQVRDLELEIKRLKGNLKGPKEVSKEQFIEIEQQLAVTKQRFREAQDELDELRLLVEDQQKQLDDYRNKYLEAQQQVEEQRRQIDLMEIENQRISEQVNLEIHRVKIQFSEKVQELMPLPDILKATQIKLQEAQQMHLLAERNNEAIARELKLYKDKIAAMTSEIDDVKSDQQMGQDAKSILEARVKELEEQLAELQQVNASLVNDLEKFAEKCDEYEKLADERLHEIIQLESQVQSLREETARQVSRIKDRCEIVRRSMQKQIGDLERQLAQSRAQAKAAQSDRDEIRQKMQSQINNLNENFEDAQMRIRNLQGHVNFLKNSYGDTFGVGEKGSRYRSTDNKDPCDCNPIY